MRTKAYKKEMIEIDIEPNVIIEEIYENWLESKGLDYCIIKNGNWVMEESCFDLPKKVRKATKKDIEMYNAFQVLLKVKL